MYVENCGIHKAAKVKWDGSRFTVRLRGPASLSIILP